MLVAFILAVLFDKLVMFSVKKKTTIKLKHSPENGNHAFEMILF